MLIGKMVDVLDKGYVQLLDMMPHPATGISGDLAIVNNARVSYLGESKGVEADKKLLVYMMRERHSTPFESVVFKFRLKMPLVAWWQLVRHRTFSFNLQSGRYTPFEEDEFLVPDIWRLQSKSNKQGSEGQLNAAATQELNTALLDTYYMGFRRYERALELGVAREQARLFLPGFAVYYVGVITVNAHNLMHMLGLRMDKHAQEETRVFADAIYYDFFKPLLPQTAEAFEEYKLKPMGVIE